jgi:hypothetical protein
MSNMTNTSAKSSDRYFLEDQERWESLGFDWESWNATVTKILRKQTVMSSSETGMKPRATHSRGRLSSSNWMA